MARSQFHFTKKKCAIHLDIGCQNLFSHVKECLHIPKIMIYPDTTQPYYLYCDASKYGYGGIWMQKRLGTTNVNDITYHPIAYISITFTASQTYPALVM